jgi:hypothetical protein
MRKTLLLAGSMLALVATAPLGAQAAGDPTAKIVGSGKLPDGWLLRFDPMRTRRDGTTPPAPALTDINFVTMGSGYHLNSGPGAIYYNTKDVGTGQFAASTTFSQTKSLGHEAAGIFIGGKNLQDSTQTYLYFAIKPADGTYLINQRTSDAAPRKIVPLTPDAAINKEDATGKATNELTIHVAKDTVHFVANGKLVKALAKSELNGMSTDGQAGLRLNHNTDIHISGVSIKK